MSGQALGSPLQWFILDFANVLVFLLLHLTSAGEHVRPNRKQTLASLPAAPWSELSREM